MVELSDLGIVTCTPHGLIIPSLPFKSLLVLRVTQHLEVTITLIPQVRGILVVVGLVYLLPDLVAGAIAAILLGPVELEHCLTGAVQSLENLQGRVR